MKVIIETEERDEAMDMLNVWKYKAALWEIQQNVRSMWKHEDMPEKEYERVDKIYQMICDAVYEAERIE